MDQSPSPLSIAQPRITKVTFLEQLSVFAQVVFAFSSLAVFLCGISGHAYYLTASEGYDEVFTVVGSLFVFPFVFVAYRLLYPYFPTFNSQLESTLWYNGLRVALAVVYGIQQGFLLAYLTHYVSRLCYVFLLGDIVLLFLMILSTKFTSVWANLYVLLMAVKMGIFWPILDQSKTKDNPFANLNNTLGPNGLLAILMTTIPIIQFPVLISKLGGGSTTIVDAYTGNMAAVFAHTLHYMDVLELYFQGQERLKFADDVQYLLLLFALMGFVSCNLYYISLFFSDDTVQRIVKKFQPTAMDAMETTKDETLLHYFMWVVFFVDLPYACMRFIAFLVHGTTISTFFAKNLMMMASVAMLMVQHSRERK